MNQLFYRLLIVLGLLLGVAGASFAQSGASLIDFTQLTADEREQLRSQLRNRSFQGQALSASGLDGSPLRSGLSASERQALRELLREIDSRQGLIRPTGSSTDVNIEALNDASQISEPIASNEPFVDTLDKPRDGWPLFDSSTSHTRSIGQ